MVQHRAQGNSSSVPSRPGYMVRLGLLPPYAVEDVKRAFLDKVRQAHPDRGGTPESFHELETAYQQALEHVRFHSDRRNWIAAHMEEYIAHQRCTEALETLGLSVEVDEVDWFKRSLGDFSAITEYIIAIHAPERTDATEIVDQLSQHLPALNRLKTLDLSGSSVNDELVYELRVFRSLVVLDLSQTPITKRALGIVHWLPALQRLDVTGTRVSWWSQLKAQRFLDRRVRQAGAIDAAVHPVNLR